MRGIWKNVRHTNIVAHSQVTCKLMLGQGRGLSCESEAGGSPVCDELSDLVTSVQHWEDGKYFQGEVSGTCRSTQWWPRGRKVLGAPGRARRVR